MAEHAHDWRLTGKSRLVDIETPRGSGGLALHRFVRCAICRAVGFRRGDSPVVYTWEQ